jgi:hypothetical protein
VREVNAENRKLKAEIERLHEQHNLALRVHDEMAEKIERLREALEAAMSANYERRKWP